MSRRYVLIPLRGSDGDVRDVATVDGDIAERVIASGPWHLSDGYAKHVVWADGKQSGVYMHRFVLGLGPGDPQVDHINRNRLDNRRENLRLATDALNRQNVGAYKNSTSRHRGVSWCKQTQRWRATARHDGKQVHLGRFDTEEEAAEAAQAFRRMHMPYSDEAAA